VLGRVPCRSVLSRSRAPRHPHSFPTRRSSALIDSRLAADGRQVRRRRQCLDCNERFTTFETAELVMPRVIKSDKTRQPFDEDKRSEEHTSELQSRENLVCRLLLEKKKKQTKSL